MDLNIKNNSRKVLDFDPNKLHQVDSLHSNLKQVILNPTKFQEIKNNPFYANFIKSIKFIPLFQGFGFSKYLLWGKVSDLSKIKKRTLLLNTFLEIKIPSEIHPNYSSFLISYLFPYRSPNTSYLNWLIKTQTSIF